MGRRQNRQKIHQRFLLPLHHADLHSNRLDCAKSGIRNADNDLGRVCEVLQQHHILRGEPSGDGNLSDVLATVGNLNRRDLCQLIWYFWTLHHLLRHRVRCEISVHDHG